MNVAIEQFAQLSADLVCVLDHQRTVQWANQRWQSLLGWPVDALRGRCIDELVHPDDLKKTRAAFVRVLEEGLDLKLAHRCRNQQGEWQRLEWSAKPAEEGLVYASARIVNTRSGYREPNEEAGDGEIWQLASQLANIGYMRLNTVTGEAYWSDQLYRIHGYEPGSFAPSYKRARATFHPDDVERIKHQIDRSVRYGEQVDIRHRLVRPNKEVRHVRMVNHFEKDDDGKLLGMYGVVQDVTEDNRLRRANRELEEFSYVVSHDLTESVRTISSYADLLLEQYELTLDHRGKKFLGYIQAGSKRMRSLIDDLLTYSRLTEPAPLKTLSLNAILTDVQSDLQAQIERKQATLIVPELPNVAGDEVRLRQLFSNIISNAIKFHGEEPPRVTLSAMQKGALVEVRVADNGIGIEPRFREKVLRPFQRMHARSRFEGTGIGLSIAQRVVEENDGQISLEDGPNGRGTTVVFTLPSAV